MNKPEHLIVHHEGAVTTGPRFEIVNQYHKEKFNFISSLGFYCGYHYFIERDGEVIQARLDTDEGAHTIGWNKKSLGICLAGGFDTTYPTWEQRISLKNLLHQKAVMYNIPLKNIGPHRNYGSPKSCFGNKLDDSWARNLLLGGIDAEQVSVLKQLLIHLSDLLKRKRLGTMEGECEGGRDQFNIT